MLEANKFLTSPQIDTVAIEHLGDIYNSHGPVKIRNKFRELKARFLRTQKKMK